MWDKDGKVFECPACGELYDFKDELCFNCGYYYQDDDEELHGAD